MFAFNFRDELIGVFKKQTAFWKLFISMMQLRKLALVDFSEHLEFAFPSSVGNFLNTSRDIS